MTETTAFRAKMGAIFLFGIIATVALFAGIAKAEPFNGVYAGADVGYETSSRLNAGGAEYGGFIGYNFKAAPALVIGLEGRIGGSTVNETITTTTPTAITIVDNDIGLSIGGTGRIGWLPGETTLLFVRGGYETVELNSIWTRTPRPPAANPNPVSQDFGFWQGSATVGGGVEQLVWDRLSLRLTYDWSEGTNAHQLRTGVAWNF
jgi:opacity protein-like surface antigen